MGKARKMTRDEKITVIEHARANMAHAYAQHMTYGRGEYLTKAAQYATVIAAMLADL
jgi:hypothetical protein